MESETKEEDPKDPGTWSRDTLLRVCENMEANRPGEFFRHLALAIIYADSVNIRKTAELFGDTLTRYYID